MLLLGRMMVQGIQPDAFTFNAIIHAYCKEGKVSIAACLLGQMNAVNCPRNVVAYTILISELCNQGKLSNAMVYLLKMLYEGICPNEATWNVLVRAIFTNIGTIGPIHLFKYIVEDL